MKLFYNVLLALILSVSAAQAETLVLHYDLSDASTVTVTPPSDPFPGTIATLQDKINPLNVATPFYAAYSGPSYPTTLGSKNAASFAGSPPQCLYGPNAPSLSGAFTFFAVATMTTAYVPTPIVGGNQGVVINLYQNLNLMQFWDGNSVWSNYSATIPLNTLLVIAVTSPDGTAQNASMFLNSAKLTQLYTSTGILVMNATLLGCTTEGSFLAGQIGEVRQYNSALSDTRIKTISRNLKDKWQ